MNPLATEIPADGIDQNCDNYEDCFQDADLDGFGSNTVTPSASFACSGLAITDNDEDCDDRKLKPFLVRLSMIPPLHVWLTMMVMVMAI